MKRSKPVAPKVPLTRGRKTTTLRELADHLGLAPATVSTAINGTVSSGIAPETRQRILEAARELNYRPNFLARSLRLRRTFTIGVMVPEISQGYTVMVARGIEEYLLDKGYFYLIASHHLQPELIEDYTERFVERAVDALIVVCGPWQRPLQIPVATISAYHAVKGTTSVLLDNRRAAEMGLDHLVELGHRKIAFIRGTATVPEAEVRWKAIQEAAAKIGLPIQPSLTVQILMVQPSRAEPGYNATKQLLASGAEFTAIFAFNDMCAIGAVRALREAGLRVPGDVSVLGIDDIESATYSGPGLTTIRQPLEEMGRIASATVLEQLSRPAEEWSELTAQVVVAPELVVRSTTGPA